MRISSGAQQVGEEPEGTILTAPGMGGVEI
jgi:hypothetical protein